jgi:hypothetical protein
VIGRQPWISVFSNTGRGIDIILSLNILKLKIFILQDFFQNNLLALTTFRIQILMKMKIFGIIENLQC